MAEVEKKWEQHRLEDVCPLIQKWNCEMLNMDSNQRPSILREICSIQLPKLKHLVINNNDIDSIEGLHWMLMLGMETLNLSTY